MNTSYTHAANETPNVDTAKLREATSPGKPQTNALMQVVRSIQALSQDFTDGPKTTNEGESGGNWLGVSLSHM